MHLMRSLNEIEEQISAARRAYNQAVTDLNNAIEMFPTNLIAGWMNLQRRAVFEITVAERQNVDVNALFNR
jgi:LemA protein